MCIDIDEILYEDVLNYFDLDKVEFIDKIDEIIEMLNDDEFKLKSLFELLIEDVETFSILEQMVNSLNVEKSALAINLHFDKKDNLKNICLSFDGALKVQEDSQNFVDYKANFAFDFAFLNFDNTQIELSSNWDNAVVELSYNLNKESLVSNNYEFNGKLNYFGDFVCTLNLGVGQVDVLSYNATTGKFKLGDYIENYSAYNLLEYCVEVENVYYNITIILN